MPEVFTDLYSFIGEIFSPEKLNQHVQAVINSWSIALVVIAIVFRRQIAKLFANIRNLSYKDGSREFVASWEEGIQELKAIEQASNVQISLPESSINSDFERLMELAKVNRRSAVIESWLLLEESANNILQTRRVGEGRVGRSMAVERELWQLELITPGDREILAKLRKLRNEASHIRHFDITEDEAAAYIDTALSLAARLKNLREL